MKHIDIKHHDVPRETFDHIERQMEAAEDRISLYLDQLLWWNRRINLISRDATPDQAREHIRHSLLITLAESFHRADAIIDTGTGGGLPGLPLAICYPEKRFLLNDIVTKKVLAVKQIARKLSLSNIKTTDGSVADLQVEESSLIVSKHAFKIDELLIHISHIPWTHLILYKGVDYMDELDRVDTPLSVEVHELSGGTDLPFYEGKVLLTIKRGGA